jgi:hypothetical protein
MTEQFILIPIDEEIAVEIQCNKCEALATFPLKAFGKSKKVQAKCPICNDSGGNLEWQLGPLISALQDASGTKLKFRIRSALLGKEPNLPPEPTKST